MTLKTIATFLYGLFVLIGGVMGYVKADSKVSLIAGGICGALLLVSAGLMYKELLPGWICAVVVTLALVGFFGYRFSLAYAIWPPGIMALISLIMLGILLFRNS